MQQIINFYQDMLANLGLAAVTGLALGFMFVSALLIIFYFAMAIGLYRLSIRAGEPNAWISFIPFVQYYMLGQLLERVKIGNTEITRPNLSYLFVAISVAPFLVGEMAVVGGLVILFSIIAWFVGLYFFFQKYSRFEVILTVVNILTFGYASAFIVLALSSSVPVAEQPEANQ